MLETLLLKFKCIKIKLPNKSNKNKETLTFKIKGKTSGKINGNRILFYMSTEELPTCLNPTFMFLKDQ